MPIDIQFLKTLPQCSDRMVKASEKYNEVELQYMRKFIEVAQNQGLTKEEAWEKWRREADEAVRSAFERVYGKK